MTLTEFVFAAPALAILAVVIFLALEIAASFGTRPAAAQNASLRGRIGVIIPAHNEGSGVAATVAAVRMQLRETDRIVVVADNCSDDTAENARPAGASVIERNDPARCGKGYALQFGVDHFRADPPETIVFIDADCRPEAGAVATIAARAAYLNRPVQALYLMSAPGAAGPKSAVSAFAWTLINRVRMSGLQRIAGVTRLTGAGMAFPWDIISKFKLGSGEIVEDLALTLAMIDAGAPPYLELGAVVRSELATTDAGATTQRARWEHGSLMMAFRAAPRLFARGLGGDYRSLAMAFDLAIPPLTVLAAAIAAMVAISFATAVGGGAFALTVMIWSAAIFAASVSAAWLVYGREILPLRSLAGIIPYLLGKRRVYGAEGRKSAKRWTRTDRGDDQ